jgi:hypothetical protein
METNEVLKWVHGFSRVQIIEEGLDRLEKIGGIYRPVVPDIKVVGDSGLVGPNQVCNLGFLDYLVKLIGASAGSKQIGFVALGTGGAPAAAATALPGEIMASTQRTAPTFASVTSTTAQFTATFASADSFLTLAQNLSNIGLFNHSSSNALFAGNVYASSSCNTNQSVNCTYQIRFS